MVSISCETLLPVPAEAKRSKLQRAFKRGDHVERNSEAGRVRGVIIKKVVLNIRFKSYLHYASMDEPQYIIKSDKTDHIAIHKGKALDQESGSRALGLELVERRLEGVLPNGL